MFLISRLAMIGIPAVPSPAIEEIVQLDLQGHFLLQVDPRRHLDGDADVLEVVVDDGLGVEAAGGDGRERAN